jgi:outer membrane protein assembly factor BamB
MTSGYRAIGQLWSCALLTFSLLVPSVTARADNWPRWRGPDGNAVSAESPLPLRWSKTENIRWKAEISGEGCSSPIVWEDRVFVTSALDNGKRRLVHCLDRQSGKVTWTREIADKNPETTSNATGHAACTPVTDGRHVVAFFGNAGVVCYDFSGKQLWHKSLGTFDSELGLASSPIIHEDRVILVCDHDGDRFTSFDSFLTALDIKSGKELWRTERRGVFRSWSTPVVATLNAKPQIIVNAQDELRGYDPANGKQLWHVKGMTNWVTPSPVLGHGLIFATSGRNGPVLAVKPGVLGEGEVKPVWRHETGGPYVCSPLLYGDYLYVHNEQGILSCYEAKTGKLQYKERLEGKFWTSAAAGDGKIYITNEAGTTFVVRAGTKFEVLARNALEEYSVASPAIAGGDLFLRTEKHLYCIRRNAD